MNAAAKSEENLTVEDYLKGEEISDIRHEYIGGKVYAMPGASVAHNTLSWNLTSALRSHLRGSPCAPARSAHIPNVFRVDSGDPFHLGWPANAGFGDLRSGIVGFWRRQIFGRWGFQFVRCRFFTRWP